MGLVLLALIFLTAMAVIELGDTFTQAFFAYAIYIYLGLVLLVVGLLAARGRFEEPSVLQYILSVVIVLVPVIGWLYGLFFAGKALARAKNLRYIVYIMLLIVITFTFFRRADIEEMRASLLNQPTPVTSETPIAKATETLKPRETAPNDGPRPTRTPTEGATEAPADALAPVPDCLLWSDVTLDHVSQKLCIYGEYLRIFQKFDDTYVMAFSDEPGAFQIWSDPKPMQMYLPETDPCIVVRGWVMTSGVRPIIIMRTSSVLEPCP
jgi:hypothetical protein